MMKLLRLKINSFLNLPGSLPGVARQTAGDESGVALVLTVLIIGLIVSVSLHFHKSMWNELDAAEISQGNVKLHSIAKSGYNYALALLSEDLSNNDFDSMLDNWADSEAISEDSVTMFEEGHFDLAVRDLSGKININRLVNSEGSFDSKQRELVARFLSSEEFNINPDEVNDILDAIKDWLDPDDEVTRFGAERGYYESLENPYRCRNGSLKSIEEMAMIEGITEDLLFGNEDRIGIYDFLTIYGNGKVNINTAHPVVLRSLSDRLEQEMVEDLLDYRERKEHELGDKLWYKNVIGTEEDIFDQEIISTMSTYFEIESRGIMGNRSSGIKSVVKREDGKFTIMRWGYL
ncbi:MAG: general secretion pathway protein GspK [Deltaproteobacteria bacterium]|nr:general secretion pathway protein GspK [Deltaproteobacteria bacterium]